MIFQQKCFLFDTSSMDKISMPHLFPVEDIKQNVLMSSYLDSKWRHKL